MDEAVNVVVAGGGFAGVEAVLALRELAGERVAITLVSARDALVYRPHAVREPFGLGEPEHIALAPLCAAHDVTLLVDEAGAVDVARRELALRDGGALGYDVLLLAPGGRPEPAVPGAITLGEPGAARALRDVLDRAVAGAVDRIAFVVPDGVAWPLPAYELALLAYAHLHERGAATRLDIVTPEDAPLGLFGAPAAARVRAALAARGIGLHPLDGLALLGADAVVALPRIGGPRVPGLPSTPDGFLPVDDYGRVEGVPWVYAAGDATNHPVKQGGLAAQQAEAAAGHIAALAFATVTPRPFAPRLRGLLLTGGVPLHLVGGGSPEAVSRPLWPDLGKVIGTRLGRWLGVDEPEDRPQGVELAFMLADEEATAGRRGAALEWLATAEAIAGTLPAEYEEKRRRWTLGAAPVSR